MKEKAIDIIHEQMEAAGQDNPVYAVGEALLELAQDEHSAELIGQDLENPDMSLKKCYQSLYAYASKNKTGSSFCIGPKLALQLISDFYGIHASEDPMKPVAPPEQPKIIDLFDIL